MTYFQYQISETLHSEIYWINRQYWSNRFKRWGACVSRVDQIRGWSLVRGGGKRRRRKMSHRDWLRQFVGVRFEYNNRSVINSTHFLLQAKARIATFIVSWITVVVVVAVVAMRTSETKFSRRLCLREKQREETNSEFDTCPKGICRWPINRLIRVSKSQMSDVKPKLNSTRKHFRRCVNNAT